MKTKNKNNDLKIYISIIIVSIFNALLNYISHSNHWNLPLDTIGTFLIAMECGYFPGILVAFFTNILESIYLPSITYVLLLNSLMAFTATYFYKKSFFKRPLMVALFIAGCSLLSWLFEMTLSMDNFAGIQNVFYEGTSLTESSTWVQRFLEWRLVRHAIDKTICLGAAFLIMKLTPPPVRVKVQGLGWKQRPITDHQMEKIAGFTKPKNTIGNRIVLVVVVVCGSIMIVFLGISQSLFSEVSREEVMQDASSYAILAADEVNGDMIEEYLEKGKSAEGYDKTLESLQRIYDSSDKILGIHILQVRKDGVYVVFDITSPDYKPREIGERVALEGVSAIDMDSLLMGEMIEGNEVQLKDTSYMSSYIPILNSDKELACYACVDVDLRNVTVQNINFLFRMVALGLGFLMVVVSWTLWLAKYHLIYPINSIVYRAGQFDFSDDEARKKNMDKVRELDIRTGSEIENLYYAFLQMVEESMVNFTYLQIKSDQMNRLQTGLIYVLADLVENRDSSTGDHIKKTAAYVSIILRKMQEMGYYNDQLTEIFIENCVKSAPLHDIGKIKIPDAILNKPGKLTEEEFEIMKTHAKCGADIIQQVIDTLPNSQYLYEAKRIAGFHHEKWNGKGYPEGLQGEEIPLSARVMAVADVFDALVSVRCYKNAMSYDEAMDIIKKDAGSHFDPKVVEAFVAASDEVKQISDEFARHSHIEELKF